MLSGNTPLARAKSMVDRRWITSKQYIDTNSTEAVGDRRLYMPVSPTSIFQYTDNDKNYLCRLSNCLYERVDPATFSFCSNHNDRNGNAMFVGDIISNDWCYCEDYAVICFGEYKSPYMTNDYPQGHFGFYVQSIAPTKASRELLRKDLLYFANQCEIVGNIYDNPELVHQFINGNEELHRLLFGE